MTTTHTPRTAVPNSHSTAGQRPCPNLSHTPAGHPLTCGNTESAACPNESVPGHTYPPGGTNTKAQVRAPFSNPTSCPTLSPLRGRGFPPDNHPLTRSRSHPSKPRIAPALNPMDAAR